MLNIDKYLEKFSKNLNSAESEKKQIIEIIKKHTSLVFSLDLVEIKDCIVYIKTSPALKNKIFIHKKAILLDTASLVSIKIVEIK